MTAININKTYIKECGIAAAYILSVLEAENTNTIILTQAKQTELVDVIGSQNQLEAALNLLEFKEYIQQEKTSSNIRISLRHQSQSKEPISSWQAQQSDFDRLMQQGIPQSFSQQQVAVFSLFCQEKNIDMADERFVHWVIRAWRKKETSYKADQDLEQTLQKAQQGPSDESIDNSFYPNFEAQQILKDQGIHTKFINQYLPHFILYWKEKNVKTTVWNTKFIKFIQDKWHISNNTETANPCIISKDWRPSQDAVNLITSLYGLSMQTIEKNIPPFILYWRDRNIANISWDSIFCKYIKNQKETPEDLPDAHIAYLEAATSKPPRKDIKWSHPLVYEAGKSCGWYFLMSSPEYVAFPLFKKHYLELAKKQS